MSRKNKRLTMRRIIWAFKKLGACEEGLQYLQKLSLRRMSLVKVAKHMIKHRPDDIQWLGSHWWLDNPTATQLLSNTKTLVKYLEENIENKINEKKRLRREMYLQFSRTLVKLQLMSPAAFQHMVIVFYQQ